MHQINSIGYIPDLALSNKYLEVIIQCLEPKIFNEKFEVLLYKIKKNWIKNQLSYLISNDSEILLRLQYIYLIELSQGYK